MSTWPLLDRESIDLFGFLALLSSLSCLGSYSFIPWLFGILTRSFWLTAFAAQLVSSCFGLILANCTLKICFLITSSKHYPFSNQVSHSLNKVILTFILTFILSSDAFLLIVHSLSPFVDIWIDFDHFLFLNLSIVNSFAEVAAFAFDWLLIDDLGFALKIKLLSQLGWCSWTSYPYLL